MVDPISNNVSRIEPPGGMPQADPSTNARNQPDPVNLNRGQTAPASSSKVEAPKPEEQQAANPESQVNGSSMTDVRVRFQVDPKTEDITVLIVDRQNKKVLRTIPPEEIENYKDSGLFNLFT